MNMKLLLRPQYMLKHLSPSFHLRKIIPCAIIFASLTLSPRMSWAYGPACHYALTYYAAMHVGYTQMQARRIASACVAVDSPESTATEPVQHMSPLRAAQVIRGDYHAFIPEYSFKAPTDSKESTDSNKPTLGPMTLEEFNRLEAQKMAPLPSAPPTPTPTVPPSIAKRKATKSTSQPKAGATKAQSNTKSKAPVPVVTPIPSQLAFFMDDGYVAVKARRFVLENWSHANHNPGVLLHFVQDQYAHAGYGTRWGHFDSNNQAALLGSFGLPLGSTTDSLNFEPRHWFGSQRNDLVNGVMRHLDVADTELRNVAMVKDTLKVLEEFLPAGQQKEPDAEAKTLAFLQMLQAIDPLPPTTFSDLVKIGWNEGRKKLGMEVPNMDEIQLNRAIEVLRLQMKRENRPISLEGPMPYIYKKSSNSCPIISDTEMTLIPSGFSPGGNDREFFSIEGYIRVVKHFSVDAKTGKPTVDPNTKNPEAIPVSAKVFFYSSGYSIYHFDELLGNLHPVPKYALIKTAEFSIIKKEKSDRGLTDLVTCSFSMDRVPVGDPSDTRIEIYMSDGSTEKGNDWARGGPLPPTKGSEK